jgi:hypothetical protein
MLEQSFSLPHSLISLGCVRVCVSHNETTQSPSECRVARNVLVTFRSVAVVSQHPRELASSAVVSVDKLGAHSCARVAVQYHSCHQHLIEMKHSSRDVLPLHGYKQNFERSVWCYRFGRGIDSRRVRHGRHGLSFAETMRSDCFGPRTEILYIFAGSRPLHMESLVVFVSSTRLAHE